MSIRDAPTAPRRAKKDALCKEGVDKSLVTDDCILDGRCGEGRYRAEVKLLVVVGRLGRRRQGRSSRDRVCLEVKPEAEDGLAVKHAEVRKVGAQESVAGARKWERGWASDLNSGREATHAPRPTDVL